MTCSVKAVCIVHVVLTLVHGTVVVTAAQRASNHAIPMSYVCCMYCAKQSFDTYVLMVGVHISS